MKHYLSYFNIFFNFIFLEYRGSKLERHDEENIACLVEQKQQKKKAKKKGTKLKHSEKFIFI